MRISRAGLEKQQAVGPVRIPYLSEPGVERLIPRDAMSLMKFEFCEDRSGMRFCYLKAILLHLLELWVMKVWLCGGEGQPVVEPRGNPGCYLEMPPFQKPLSWAAGETLPANSTTQRGQSTVVRNVLFRALSPFQKNNFTF